MNVRFSSVQSLSRVRLSATPWTKVRQISLSIINSRSLLNLMSIELVDMMVGCYPTISCSVIPFSSHLQSFRASGSFQMSQLFTSGGQSIGASASSSVLPMNIQDWFPLGWTCWLSLPSKGLSRVFSNTTAQQHQFFGQALPYFKHQVLDYWKGLHNPFGSCGVCSISMLILVKNHSHYSVPKTNKILPFAITRMNLEGIMLSEVSQTFKKNT